MIEEQVQANGYACGVGGFSSRGLPPPMVCPTAYPELWEKSRPPDPYRPSRRWLRIPPETPCA